MKTAIGEWWHRVWRRVTNRPDQRGQSLVVIVIMFVGILAFIGLGIDLASVYTERIKISRAVDAAALAAASDLPYEDAAHQRALVYLRDNGYDATAADTEVIEDTYDVVEARYTQDSEAMTVIWLDTQYSREEDEEYTADRVRVRVRRQVWMVFMQFVGFHHFPVEATATAENISNIDTVIVYDSSGSMEFDTLCYGCREGDDVYPLHWSDTAIDHPDHCAGWDGSSHNCGGFGSYNYYYEANDCYYRDKSDSSLNYTVIEAEYYSNLSVQWGEDWNRTQYVTFWVMQHNGKGAYYQDGIGTYRGAYLAHHPFCNYEARSGTTGVACSWTDLLNGRKCRRGLTTDQGDPIGPYANPRADYRFYAPNNDRYYFWIRGQGGESNYDRHVFWGLNGSPMGQESYFPTSPLYEGASSSSWDWRCLGSADLSAGTHTFNMWAGGAGFNTDRIVIQTDDRYGACGDDSNPPSRHGSSYRPFTFEPNNGRTDWACLSCDPRFGGRPGGQTPSPAYRPNCDVGGNPDQRENDLYGGQEPIRKALEAAKWFISNLDPKLDQIGYVPYNSRVDYCDWWPYEYEYPAEDFCMNELECVRRLGIDDCTEQVFEDTVINKLDLTYADGSTNMAEGIKVGNEVLSTSPGDGHYGRPGAAHIMILMTDGIANTRSGCDSACDDDSSLWHNGGAAKDCVVYYARQARNNGIVIYTISLGYGADMELMEYIADLTGGEHFPARPVTEEALFTIFDELFKKIFLRLVG